MPYVKIYDPAADLLFQSEIPEETKQRALSNPDWRIEVSDTPFENLPILPRCRSQWPDRVAKQPERPAAGSENNAALDHPVDDGGAAMIASIIAFDLIF